MPNLIITPANVLPVTELTSQNYITAYPVAVAVTAGQSLYLDTDNIWQLADATANRNNLGIALNNAAANQVVGVMRMSGTLDLGVTLGQSIIYVVSATPGAIAPLNDLVPTNYVNILGYGNDVNQLVLQPYNMPLPLA